MLSYPTDTCIGQDIANNNLKNLILPSINTEIDNTN